MCVHFRAAKDGYLCRCRSASFFRRMAASEYDVYLHSIIHISCLVFFGRMKYKFIFDLLLELPERIRSFGILDLKHHSFS